MDTLSAFLSTSQTVFMTRVITNLTPYAGKLFIALATIDLILTTLKNLGDPDTFKKLCFNLLRYGGVAYAILNFAMLTGVVFQSCVDIGGVAATGSFISAGEVSQYPGQIFDQGLDCFTKVFDNPANYLPSMSLSLNIFSIVSGALKNILLWPVKIIICILVALLTLICFSVLAIEVFMILMEFYICAGVAVMFIPFAACRQTSFLTQKSVSVMIGFGIKVIFVVLVATVAKDQLGIIVGKSDGTLEGLFKVLFGVAGFTFLTWQVPKIAMGFLGGSPSQGASGVISSAMRAGGAVVGVAAGAAKAAGGLYQAAKTGAAGASAGGGGGISAASKMGGSGGSVGSAASIAGTGEGGGISPSSLAPQKSGSKTQNGDATGSSKGSETQNSGATGSSVETASKRSKLSGALKGMGQYIASNTSFGKGMADAEYKAEMRDRMKNRLKGGGGGTANSTNPNRVSNEIRRRNEDDDD
jgi:type IV secretion system protein TrbL